MAIGVEEIRDHCEWFGGDVIESMKARAKETGEDLQRIKMLSALALVRSIANRTTWSSDLVIGLLEEHFEHQRSFKERPVH